jgi:GxxExxY protein
MPVHCPIAFPRLSKTEFGKLDYAVMPHAFAAQKDLGCLCDEAVYQSHFAHLLRAAGFQVDCEVPVTLTFRSFLKTLYLDLVINHVGIYELKAVTQLTAAHFAQLLNYLLLVNASRGKLINYRPASVDPQFVNAALDDHQRRNFCVRDQNYSGPQDFRQLVVELLTDWGTSLDQSLYTQALVACLGGDEHVIQQLPMLLDDVPIGNQRFHLASPDEAFRITTFQDELTLGHQLQLRKLMAPSPLKAIHWINIAHHEVSLITLGK